MFRYRVYGLTLAANAELPLNPYETNDGPVDFLLDFASDGNALAERIARSEPLYVSRNVVSGQPAVTLWSGRGDDEYLFRFYDGIALVVDRVRGVVACNCATELEVQAAGHHVLFSLMGFLLSSRNAMPLHGAAIRSDDGVVALLGRPQSGKSVVSIELAAAGVDVLSDELVAVRPNAEIFEVARGYPWAAVRTTPDDLITHGVRASGLPWRYLGDTYRSWALPNNSHSACATLTEEKLTLICILSPRARGDPWIEDVSPREACIAVMEAAARTHIPFPDLARRELDIAAQLASSVPARCLNYQVPNGGLARALHMALRHVA